jgi:hypothetical protein
MRIVKSVIGYAWGACAVLIVLASFIGSDYFSHKLAEATNVTISPWFSGGEVMATMEHGAYRALVHRPVFHGLFSERDTGFIQIQWEPREALPATVKEAIDYDGDGRTDFTITLDTTTGRAALSGQSPSVVSIEGTYKLKKGWAARVVLSREK